MQAVNRRPRHATPLSGRLFFIKNDAEDHGRKPVDESVSYF
jgi:hypothetical protein